MTEKVTIRDAIGDLWRDLSGAQRFVTVSLVALFVGLLVTSWVNTFQTWSEVRVYEQQAAKAEMERVEALERAAEIASQIKIREQEVFNVEAKRDAKAEEVKQVAEIVQRERDNYERAVRYRLPNTPSTSQLCADLAGLGYPCHDTDPSR